MPSTAVPPSNFKSFFDAALADYLKQTGVDLIKYPLDEKLQNCHSVDDVLGLFQDKSKQFKDYRDGNSKLINCLNPAVKVIHVLSDILGEAASLVSLLSSIIIKSCLCPPHPGAVSTNKSNLCWHRCSPRSACVP